MRTADAIDGSTFDNVITIADDDDSRTGNDNNVIIIDDCDKSNTGDETATDEDNNIIIIADNDDTSICNINITGKRSFQSVYHGNEYNPINSERENTTTNLYDKLRGYSDIDIEKVAAKFYVNKVEGFEATTGSEDVNLVNDLQSDEAKLNYSIYFYWIDTLKNLINFELNTRR